VIASRTDTYLRDSIRAEYSVSANQWEDLGRSVRDIQFGHSEPGSLFGHARPHDRYDWLLAPRLV